MSRVKYLLGVVSVGALFVLPAAAQGEIVFQTNFGTAGSTAGRLSNPAGLAVNATTGHIYVADRGNNRVDEFAASGAAATFVRAWGFDVVASGEDDKPFANEADEVRIRANSGSFGLLFEGEETTQLPYSATAAEVQSALNALPKVNSKGSVTVGGGPGEVTGANPYVVTFSGGTLATANLELGIETSGLGIPSGTQLSCAGGPSSAGSIEYQWLANGTPVTGETSATFTPAAGEEGEAIQCRVAAVFGQARTLATSRPYHLASPAPGTLPPLGPVSLAAPTGSAILESAGGVPLTCNAGTWSRNPENFTYQWYRNGQPIGSTTTTAATSDEYVLTQADLATRAVFQCAVTGNNAGGSSTTISKFAATNPEPIDPEAGAATASVSVAAGGASKIITRTNGGAVLEVCKASPSTDVCKAGVAGNGVGQFSAPRSIAVDNSPAGGGAVYAMDDGNPRVQKFSAEGTPILMLGGGVDQTTDGNVCTVASGDACGEGVLDKNGGPGGFGGAPSVSDSFAELGNELAVDAAGLLYVADARANGDPIQPRIQKFEASGAFLSQAKVPYLFANTDSPERPVSVTADSSKRAFAAVPGESGGVERFSPAEFSASGAGATRAGNMFHQDGSPRQLALDPRNDRLLVSDPDASELLSICGGTPDAGHAIVEYDTGQNRIDCSVPTGTGALPQVTGLAVSSAGLLYVAVGSKNIVKVFSLPSSSAPQVDAPSVTNITTESAHIRSAINPGFEDTTYKVEYGLAKCASSPCESAVGGVLHGVKFVGAEMSIAGLTPNTTYHYRVVAENKLGTVKGPDLTFTTFPLVDLVNDPCPNALARKQTKTAGLLDCRAYELASAAFSGGYDVESDLVSGQSPFGGFPEAEGRLLYGLHEGGIPNTGQPTNRGLDPYLASRAPSGRWSTKYLGIPADNPFAIEPFASTLAGAGENLDTLAFAGPDICSPCFADGSAGIPVRLPSGELVQGMSGSIPQLAAEPAGHIGKPLSADGTHLIFGSMAQFEPAANKDGKLTIYSRDLDARTTAVVSTLPDGSTMAGAEGEAGELDVSEDGSRVVVGEALSVDAKGNTRWHPYLHLAGDSHSVDLAPGTTTGVYFNGMSADGAQIFFTTKDKLLPAEDTDESADIYETEVDQGAVFDLRLVSTKANGSPSNSDACAPAGEPASWNAAAGNGKCGALAFAGGAGLAAENAGFYFTSPEKLDGSKGAQDQPNLYLARAGANPRFIATIDTSAGKPGPQGPVHPLLDSNFGDTGYEAVQALTVDQSNGDLFAIDGGEGGGKVYRYDSTGAPKNFSAGPDAGTNALTGFSFANPSAAQVAVDNSASPFAGNFYVASRAGIGVYAPSGEKLGLLDGSGTSNGSFESACGVAVDQSSGAVYVADVAGYLWRYQPVSAAAPVKDSDYTVKGLKTGGMTPCAVAADSAGHIYAANFFEGPVRRFLPASFVTGSPLSIAGVEVDPVAKALATDPATNDLYVDEGAKISVFDSTGTLLETIGAGKFNCGLLGSRGVAVDKTSHHVYAACYAPSSIKEFGYEVPAYTPVDNPAILHATAGVETHSFADFQTTPDGRYAAFATTRPLRAGYDNASHSELYRYDVEGAEGVGHLDCVSCSPTGSQAQSDSGLPPHGLGLLQDGRVFFNSAEQLTLRDTNGKLDAYEWSGGAQQLISSGSSAFPSGMLGASADGVDAFFFTRDVLVGEDKNGQAMKVYDARENGGFFVVPPPPPCAASDECHGPGTKAADPPPIGTFKGSGGQVLEETTKPGCRKPKVRRRGKCIKPHKHKPRQHRSKGGKAKRGGGR